MFITVAGEKKEVKDGLTLPELIAQENVEMPEYVPLLWETATTVVSSASMRRVTSKEEAEASIFLKFSFSTSTST